MELLEFAECLCEALVEDTTQIISEIYNTRITLACKTNDAENCKKYSQKLQKDNRETGQSAVQIASAYTDLGIAHSMSGEYWQGLEYFRKSTRELESVKEPTPDPFSAPLYHSVISLWHLGEHQKADAILETILNHPKIFEPDGKPSAR